MSHEYRAAMAANIVATDIVPFDRGVVTYTPAHDAFTIPDHTGASSGLSLLLWGSLTSKAVLTSFENSAAGITASGCNVLSTSVSSGTLLHVVQIDRMNDLGNLTNSESISLSVLAESGTLAVFTCNSTHLDWVSILLEGGTVEQMNSSHFNITVPHTSALAILSEPNVSPSPNNSIPSDGSNFALLGLLALLVLPLLVAAILWWKQARMPQTVEYRLGEPVPFVFNPPTQPTPSISSPYTA